MGELLNKRGAGRSESDAQSEQVESLDARNLIRFTCQFLADAGDVPKVCPGRGGTGCRISCALPRIHNVLGCDPIAVVKVGVVAEVESVDLAIRRDIPVSGDVGYHVQILIHPDETSKYGIEWSGDRPGVKGGIKRVRLLSDKGEYIVRVCLRRVGRQECEGRNYLVKGVAKAVVLRDRSECPNHKALSAAEHTRPSLLDSEFVVPDEHRTKAVRVRPQPDRPLIVNFNETPSVVRDLPVHPVGQSIGPGVPEDGYLD